MKWIRILKRLISINMPVILALLSVWYNNFFGESEALIPYTQYLEISTVFTAGNHGSNGKSIGRDGKPVQYQTGTIIWASQEQMQHFFS
jgi:glucose-6-phosphate isomerase